MTAPTSLYVVPGAGHLFEEPGALRTVISVASVWLRRQLGPPPQEARAEPR
jgi:putative phosphoribosyl transferase